MKKLNKKKGFTLVELIVVIAIIGVLAAILIPTMLNYVARSHVSNANAAAGKLRDNITYFLTQADAEGYGMFLSHTAVCDGQITITGGVWDLTITDKGVFVQHYDTQWNGSGQGYLNDGHETSEIAEERFMSYMAKTFREIENGYIEFRLIGGVCSALYFTPDQNSQVTEMPGFGPAAAWAVDTFQWDGRNDGITPSGLTVGTSPVLLST